MIDWYAGAWAAGRDATGSSPTCIIVASRGRHQLFFPSVYSNYVARTYGHGPTRSDDATTSDHSLTPSRRQEVRLVFDGQNRASGWHQSHRGITARDVDDRGENSSSHEAMVLSKVRPKGQRDFHLAG